ncbi:MAG TPA: hypothetical protein VFG05_05160 [Methylocella sp.]|nr:hypothetical protein [Methylocella sp.]
MATPKSLLKPAAWLLASGLALAFPAHGRANGSRLLELSPSYTEAAAAGVPCNAGAPFWAPIRATAAMLPWQSVWLGHFSGGRPYPAGNGVTLIDWRDEKFCFPSRRACDRWIADLRQAYHDPEGYWTCLVLR